MRGCIRSITFLIFICLVLVIPSHVDAADVPLDSPLYPILDRLWAEGKIDGYRPGSLPISREEAEDLLAGTANGEELIDAFLGPVFQLNPWIGAEGGSDNFIPDNASGIPVSVGPVAGIEGVSDGGILTAYFNYRYPVGDDESRFTEAYLRYRWKRVMLTYGKEDLWWGPGRRGDLLITNNAEAREMLRIDNYPAFTLPLVFRHLGGVRVNFFLSRLEDNRPLIDEPLMGGMKVSIMPHENFIFSINRTFLYGGEGRDEDLATFFDVLLGLEGSDHANKNVIGNQLGGFSLVWRIPGETQPAVIYWELAGEDRGGKFFTLISSIAGVYLPRLGMSERYDLRIEAAATDITKPDSGQPVWYGHHEYPYNYFGRIMGHPVGQDARDIYAELGIYPSESSRIALSASHTWSGVTSDSDLLRTYGLQADTWEGVYTASLQWQMENWDNVPAGEEEGTLFAVKVKRRW